MTSQIPKTFTIKILRDIAKHYKIKLSSTKKADIIKELTDKTRNIPDFDGYIEKLKENVTSKKKGKKKTTRKKTTCNKIKKTTQRDLNSIQSLQNLNIEEQFQQVVVLSTQIREINQRLTEVEKKIKFILDRMITDGIRNDYSPIVNSNHSNSDNDQESIEVIKNELLKLISPKESLSVDKILEYPQFNSVSLQIIEKAILDLVDDEEFDVSEGNSSTKIDGNIGLIIRR